MNYFNKKGKWWRNLIFPKPYFMAKKLWVYRRSTKGSFLEEVNRCCATAALHQLYKRKFQPNSDQTCSNWPIANRWIAEFQDSLYIIPASLKNKEKKDKLILSSCEPTTPGLKVWDWIVKLNLESGIPPGNRSAHENSCDRDPALARERLCFWWCLPKLSIYIAIA
jgi:hypothetical protein